MAFLRYTKSPSNLELVTKPSSAHPTQEEELMISFLRDAIGCYQPGADDYAVSRKYIKELHDASPRSLPLETMAKIYPYLPLEIVNEQGLAMSAKWHPNSINVYSVDTYEIDAEGYSIPLNDDPIAMREAKQHGLDTLAYQLDTSKKNGTGGYDHHYSLGYQLDNRGRTYVPVLSILHADHPARQSFQSN
ncbi:MAG: hypothetical protein U0524_01535 [Candidatus Saccharimonadales bacterium]